MTEFFNHFHMCGGVGSGAAGMNDADPSIGPMRGQMRCVGGIYTGTDLQPITGRPGAMAAFALPSRMGRRLFYRDGVVDLIADGARRKGGAA